MQQNQEYKQIVGLLKHAQELSSFNPVYSYITKAYAAQRIHALYKKTQQQELMKQLQTIIGELEAAKTQNPQLTNKEENKKSYTEFVYKFFYDADTRERDGEVSPELMQMFGSIQKAIEVLQYFEPLTQDQLEKQKYAKFKMVDQHKKIKDPSLIKPKAADPLDDELEQIAKQQQQQQQQQQIPSTLKSQAQQPKQEPPHQPQNQGYQQPFQQPQQPYSQPQQQNYQQPPNYQPPQYPKQVQPSPVVQPPQQGILILYLVNQQQEQKQPTAKLSAMQQIQIRNEVKSMLQQSISELDFKKFQNAKDQLVKALGMIQQILDSQ